MTGAGPSRVALLRFPARGVRRGADLGHLHLDRARLRLGALRQVDREHAELRLGPDLLGVERARQRERPREGAERPLDAVVALALVLGLELPLAAQGSRTVLEPNVDVLRLDAGEVEAERHALGVLEDVAGGRPADRLAGPVAAILEHPVHLVLQPHQVPKGLPSAHHCHGFRPPWFDANVKHASRLSNAVEVRGVRLDPRTPTVLRSASPMLMGSIARRYAKALFSLAVDTGRVEAWAQTLESLRQAVESSADLRDVLSNPVYSKEQRRAIVEKPAAGL